MIGRRRFFIPALLAMVAAALPAQTGNGARGPIGEDVQQLLLQGAFQININARIVDSQQNSTVWNMELTRVTVSGRAVTVRLEGSNITVVAEFTPVRGKDNELVLVAQGQTWVRTGNRPHDVQYRTTFTTLPISLGQPIVFLPLGAEQSTISQGEVPIDTDRFGRLNIELEVNVVPYGS